MICNKNFRDKNFFYYIVVICLLAGFLFIELQERTFPTSLSLANGIIVDISHIKRRRYNFPQCTCFRNGLDTDELRKTFNVSFFGESTCSDFALQRGYNQKVISFSYYSTETRTDTDSLSFKKYFGMMDEKLKFIQSHMPDWVVRIYHNVSTEDEAVNKKMCNLYCSFDNVDFCNVTNLPTFGNLQIRQPIGRLWRFAVMGDPTVCIFLSRDTDNVINIREIEAVNAWLKQSSKEFHLMRDSPNHLPKILAGLWGGWNNRTKELASLRDMMFAEQANFEKRFDQQLLEKYVWPFIQGSVLQHDSFFCMTFPDGTTPFPTKRTDNKYAGYGPLFPVLDDDVECPMECRPKNHRDWDRC